MVFNTPYIGVVGFRDILESDFSDLDSSLKGKLKFDFNNKTNTMYIEIAISRTGFRYKFKYELIVTETDWVLSRILCKLFKK